MARTVVPHGPVARDVEVDLLVVGSGTGLAAALTAHELGLRVLVVDKSQWVGGNTAKSGGAFWIPANRTLLEAGAADSAERALTYVRELAAGDVPDERLRAYVEHGPAALDTLAHVTPMRFFWAREYSDYHPELPGGSPAGRTCECRPFDLSVLGSERNRLQPGVLEAPVPMPVTGADYRWMNLIAKAPVRAVPRILRRVAEGVGGAVVGRRYAAGGQALAAGLYAGALRAAIPVWTRTTLVEIVTEGDRVVGAIAEQDGRAVRITARRGVVLAAGGFEHAMQLRHEVQSPSLVDDVSLGVPTNTGDGIQLARGLGADVSLMDQAWWFPAVRPLRPGTEPGVLLAERSLPGSLMVGADGRRFINESVDYMSFGQRVLAREAAGTPVGTMWLVFDQEYRNSYVFGGVVFPRMPIPQAWFDAGVAVRGSGPQGLAAAMRVPADAFASTIERFNILAALGHDDDFQRGDSAYDRYYGDPTITPNPNLRALDTRRLYAVQVVLSDLGTCGGLRADEHARVLNRDGKPIAGLYAIGNTAANAFGKSYPGAGATIGQGLVFGYLAARHAAA